MAKLSIIIPVYNVEKYLSKCLDSVLGYDEDYEVIAVNDGSTDSSESILKDYEEKYPDKLRVISIPNGGPGAARNRGIAEARGEYLSCLDSDDSYADNAIPEILEECRKGFDICFFDFVNISESGRFISRTPGCSRAEGDFTLETNPGILFDLPSGTNKIFRTSFLRENGFEFPARVWFEDLRTTPKLYPFAKDMRYVEKGWYIYLQQSSSITHGTNTARNLEIIDAVEDLVRFYKDKGFYSRYSEELEYAVFYNELLTSIDRVNLIDRKSPVQDQLLDYYLENYPDYQNNRYFKTMPLKLKLIYQLIIRRRWLALNILLRANNLIKGK